MYYSPPQPMQAPVRLVQPSEITNNAPIVSIAAIAAIVALWPAAHDPSAYRAPTKSAAILYVAPVVNNPPPFSTSTQAAIRATWPDASWGEQSEPAVAAVIPTGVAVVNNPPFAQRTPIAYKDPRGIYYGDGQYGFTYGAGAASVAPGVVNNPPPLNISIVYAVRGAWVPDAWSAQGFNDDIVQPGAGGVTPVVNNPPFAARVPVEFKDARGVYYGDGQQYGFVFRAGAVTAAAAVVNNPPPYSIASATAVRESWPVDSWPTQNAAEDLIHPYAGDEPPGALIPPDLSDFPLPTWDAQSTTRAIAALMPPPVVNAPPVVSASLVSALRSTWPDQTWGEQSAYSPIAPLTLIYGNQPPPYSVEAIAIVSSIPQPTWGPQSAPPSAAWNFIPAAVNTPPPISRAGMGAILATQSPSWGAQTAPPSAAWNVTAAPPPGPPGIGGVQASTLALVYRYQLTSWTAQSASPIAGASYIPPVVNNPQPSTRHGLYALRAVWADATWSAQAAGTIASLGLPTYLIGGPRYIIKRRQARTFTVSALTALRFDQIEPGESYPLTFDFTPDLPAGVTLTSIVSVSYACIAGVDPTPSGIADGSPGIDITATKVIVPVTVAITGNDYRIVVEVTTSDPQIVLVLVGVLPVRL